ncbi:hypothetical protein [Chthonobacter albigriseus]|uniref:hypothetical protein n=1 Tax=Chthonobacter albigriseus TaxID=1683161 RepID=UPI0015EF22A1
MPDARSPTDREKRLAEALRRNLRLRKAQAKSRRSGDADARGGLQAATGTELPVDGTVVKAPESTDDSTG